MKPEFSATAPRKIGLDSWQLTPPYLLVLRRCSTAQPGGVACRQVDQARKCQASLTGRIGHVVYFDQRLGATWTQKWGSIFRSQTCLNWLYRTCCIFRPAFGCNMDTKMRVNFPIPDMPSLVVWGMLYISTSIWVLLGHKNEGQFPDPRHGSWQFWPTEV